MPRVRPLTENERKDKAFRQQLNGMMKEEKITFKTLAQKMGISINTMYRHRDHPEEMPLREIRVLMELFPELKIN